jgi:GNAT superfamily N-acetyltransferase
MAISVRRAQEQDAKTLLRLVEELAHYEKLAPPTEEAKARLVTDAFSERPRFEAWIAELDGDAAAYAIVFETYSSFLALPTLYLEDLFVLPDCRRKGVGEALFKRLAAEALQRGCGRMEWVCLDWNRLGQDFYAKLGARQLGDWVSYRLTVEEMAALERQSCPSET